MSEIRPRQSIVNLFDPLANSTAGEAPSTPRHDVPNIDDRDKETFKDSPNGLTMSLFVDKLSEAVSHPQPPVLKRRLIDIGDMTLEDAASPEALLDEDLDEFGAGFNLPDEEDNATLTFKDMVKAATPNRSLKPVFQSPIGRALPMAQLSPLGTAGPQMTSTPSSDDCVEGLKPGALFNESILEEDEAEVPAVSSQEIDTPAPETNQPIAPEDIPLPPSPPVTAQELPTDCVGERISDGDLSLEPHHDLHISPNNADKPAYTSTPCNQQSFDQDHSNISTLSIEGSESLIADTSIPVVISTPSRPPSTTPPPDPEPVIDENNAQLRPRPSITSPQDCNRFSVDLNTSFQLHMQSADLSFDLLNDKMSLFNTQIDMESFLANTEDDPSFNLEAEKVTMEKRLKKTSGDAVKRERASVSSMDDVSSATSSSAPATPVDAPSTPSISTDGSADSPVPISSDSKPTRKRLSIPISTSSPRLVDISPLSAGTNILSMSPSYPFSPSNGSKLKNPVEYSPMIPTRSAEKRGSTLQLTTPKTFEKPTVPVMPPAVPALKILKRTRTAEHERSNSTTSVPGHPNPKPATGLKRLSISTSSKLQNLPSIAPLRTRKATTEQDNPQEKEVHVQPAGQTIKTKCFVPPRPSIPSQLAGGPGPRRVPMSEGPQLKTIVHKSTTAPPASTAPSGGPKRVVPPTTTAAHTRSASITTSSGMKPPTRLGTTNVSSATSSLPKPTPRASTSRLPAPKNLKSIGLPTLRRT